MRAIKRMIRVHFPGECPRICQTTRQSLKAIFEEDELAEAATCKAFLQVRLEGQREVQVKMCRVAHLAHPCTSFGHILPSGSLAAALEAAAGW